jgi:hypothetical protein
MRLIWQLLYRDQILVCTGIWGLNIDISLRYIIIFYGIDLQNIGRRRILFIIDILLVSRELSL